jgi:hypothetical protein
VPNNNNLGKPTILDHKKSREGSYNTIKSLIKYLEKIDEKEANKITFSEEGEKIINEFKGKLKKEIFQGYVVNADNTDISNKLQDFCKLLLDKTENNESKKFLKELEEMAKSLDLIKEMNVPSTSFRGSKVKKVNIIDSIYRIETNKDQGQTSDLQLRIFEKDEIIGIIEILKEGYDMKDVLNNLCYFERDCRKIFYINNNVSIYCDMKEDDQKKDQVNITFANTLDREIDKKLDVAELKFNENKIIYKKSDYPCYLNKIKDSKLIYKIYQNNSQIETPEAIESSLEEKKYTDLNNEILNQYNRQ